jgi:hypothetical protein
MTRGKRFKRLVRARAAETGQSYTAALRRFQTKPKEGEPMAVDGSTDLKCSFCGKTQEEVAKLVAGPGVYICDQCIRLGYDIVSDDSRDASGVNASAAPPFARFGPRAQAATVEAQHAAREMRHNFLGTEHLLLGVVAIADGSLAELLSSRGVTIGDLRRQVTDLVPPSAPPLLAAPPFTPRAMRSLQLAGEQALELAHEHIDATHLLLGLLVEGDGLGAQLLASAGIALSDVVAIAEPG